MLHRAAYDPCETGPKLDTVFPIMSMSKQFTGFLISRFFAEGLLDSTKTVGDSVEELAGLPVGDVLIPGLLGHTSGLPPFLPLSTQLRLQSSGRSWSTAEYIDVAAGLSVSGEKVFAYSDQGYSLLRVVAERLGEETYHALLSRLVFQPAGMNSTFVERADVLTPNPHFVLTSFFSRRSPVVISAPRWNTSAIRGATGIYTTADDLFRWFEFLKEIRLDDPRLAHAFFTPNSYRYAGGLFVEHLSNDDTMYWHSGYIPGYHSFIGMSFDADVFIVLLSNATCFSDLNEAPARGLVDIVRGKPYTLFQRMQKEQRIGCPFARKDQVRLEKAP